MVEFTAILLAGGLRPSRLRKRLGMPIGLLPLSPAATLFDGWLRTITGAPGCRRVLVLAGTEFGQRAYEEYLRTVRTPFGAPVSVRRDPRAHRGTAGCIRDAALDADLREDLVVLEMSALPPRSLRPLLEGLETTASPPAAILGRDREGRPAGATWLAWRTLDRVPDVGYCDLKEQCLAGLLESGEEVLVREITDRATRVLDRRGVLAAVTAWHARMRELDFDARAWSAESAQVDDGARILGHTVLEPGVQVGPGAVLEDAVLLRGVQVGANAIVARSIVAPGVQIGAGAIYVDTVVGADSLDERIDEGFGIADPQRDAGVLASARAERRTR